MRKVLIHFRLAIDVLDNLRDPRNNFFENARFQQAKLHAGPLHGNRTNLKHIPRRVGR